MYTINDKNELLNNIYKVAIVNKNNDNYDTYYYVDKSLSEIYHKIYMSNNKLFSNFCASIYDKYDNIKSLFIKNGIYIKCEDEYYDDLDYQNFVYDTYLHILHIFDNNPDLLMKIYNEVKTIINEVNITDFKNIYLIEYEIKIEKLSDLIIDIPCTIGTIETIFKYNTTPRSSLLIKF